MAFAALAAGATTAHAASDFAVVGLPQDIAQPVGDSPNPSVRKLLVFVPSNALLSGAAVLMLETGGVTDRRSELYVNPPTQTCDIDDGVDANESRSIGYLQNHNNNGAEYFAHHKVFPASFLIAGGTNRVMICARTSGGFLTPGQLDDFNVRNAVLLYRLP